MDDTVEQERLLKGWDKGSFETAQGCADWHFVKHRKTVNATSLLQYLRKAEAFRQQRRGSGQPVAGHTLGVKRFSKRGRRVGLYIDLTADDKIISFGSS